MATENTVCTVSQAQLVARLASIASAYGGTSSTPDDRTVRATLTAIKAKWLLGGRKVTSNFTCTLDPVSHEAHFRESAVETSWGVPPPSLTFHSSTQRGGRVNQSRVDKGVGGGGVLEFGAFRESVEQEVKDAGWGFVYEVG
jgi:hypothetical protein